MGRDSGEPAEEGEIAQKAWGHEGRTPEKSPPVGEGEMGVVHGRRAYQKGWSKAREESGGRALEENGPKVGPPDPIPPENGPEER